MWVCFFASHGEAPVNARKVRAHTTWQQVEAGEVKGELGAGLLEVLKAIRDDVRRSERAWWLDGAPLSSSSAL